PDFSSRAEPRDLGFSFIGALSVSPCLRGEKPCATITEMPDDAPSFEPQSQQIDDATPRGPMIVGALVVLPALGAPILAGRNARSSATAAIDPYVKNLQLSDFKLSQAENFVGGNVTYLEGKISNAGNKA